MPRPGPLVSRFDRYLFRQLLIGLIAVTGGLTALIWLTQSLRFVELVVDHGLSVGFFLELTGMLVPSFVSVILPITTFIVIAFTYNRMAGDRELTVMRSIGLSPYGLARSALFLATLTTLAGYALSLWVVPQGMRDFRKMEWEVRNRVAAFLLQDGVFTPLMNGMTVYVRSREPDGTLKGVMIDDHRNPQDHSTIFARSGRLVQTPTGPEVILNDGSRQQIDYKTGRLNILTFKENVLDLSDGSQSAARTRDMSEMSVAGLLHDQPANPRDAPRWRAEAYKRLTAPLTALSYALVALVAALTGSFKRHGSILRPIIAVLVMVGLIAFQLVAGDLAARNNAWIPLLWVQAILPGAVSAWILFAPMLTRWRPRSAPRPALQGAAS